MRLMSITVPVFLSLLILAGCASTPPLVTDSSTKKITKQAKQQAQTNKEVSRTQTSVAIPNSELTADQLYDLLLADIAARRAHLDVAVRLYSKLAQSTRDARLAERASRVAVYARDNESALSAAQLWVELDPKNDEARQLLIALYIRTGDVDAALEHMERVLDSNESEADGGFMIVAGLLSRERDKRAALDLMQRLVNRHQDNTDALFALSHLALRLGENKAASGAIDQVLLLKKDWIPAVLQKARVLTALGQSNATLSFLEQQIKRSPNVVDYRLFYARQLADDGRMPDALLQFKKIDKLQPDTEEVIFAIGYIALQLGHIDDAESYFLQLKNSGNRIFEVDYYLGRLEEERGNNAQAKKRYSAISEGEHYINAQIRIIVITAREGDIDNARALINAIKAQRPSQTLRLSLVEGEVLIDVEDYEAAFSVYNEALKEFPDNADLLYARSMVADKTDRLDIMEEDLRAILIRDPNNSEVLNALGYTLADRTERYNEALKLISRALELRPNDFHIVDSMGWVHYRMGHYDKAKKYLSRALELKMDVEVAAHLGEVLWVSGEQDAARKVWARALKQTSPTAKKNIITELMERLDK